MTKKTIEEGFKTTEGSVLWWLAQVNKTLVEFDALEASYNKKNGTDVPLSGMDLVKLEILEGRLANLIGRGRLETQNLNKIESNIIKYEADRLSRAKAKKPKKK